jgi:hypothetical protein
MSTRIDTLDPALAAIFQEPEVIAINQVTRRHIAVTLRVNIPMADAK